MIIKQSIRRIILLLTIYFISCTQKSNPTASSKNSSPTDFFQLLPNERSSLPDWYLGGANLRLIATSGAVFTWNMKPRKKGNKDLLDSVVFALPVRKNDPVSIVVETTAGYPVIMATDRMIHKNDLYALISGFSEGETRFPGRPLAYEIGNTNKVTLCINSQRNGLLNVWIWIMEGQMDYKPYKVQPYSQEIEESLPFSKEMISMVSLTDSIAEVNYLDKAWNHRGLTNSKPIKSSSVKVTIGSNQTNCRELKDIFFDLANSNNATKFFQDAWKIDLSALLKWKQVEDSVNEQKSNAIANAMFWHTKAIRLSDELFPSSIESKLSVYSSFPLLQSELIKRRQLQGSFKDSSTFHDHMRMKILMEGGELSIFTNKLSKWLSTLLPEIGGLAISVFDRSGYIVATTAPFSFSSINNQIEWKILDTAKSDRITSECYELRGYNFQLKKVVIPVKDLETSTNIGWLMAEVYCK